MCCTDPDGFYIKVKTFSFVLLFIFKHDVRLLQNTHYSLKLDPSSVLSVWVDGTFYSVVDLVSFQGR